jgi:hypothetical protein
MTYKTFALLLPLFLALISPGQPLDTTKYRITVTSIGKTNSFFRNDKAWLGADGAASVDLGNGRVLWLFSDGFISADSSASRKNSKMIRNSVAIQHGYDLNSASIQYHWDRSGNDPHSFFPEHGENWYWTGHGAMIGEKLILFLTKMKGVKTGLGFEAVGWVAVLVANPQEEPFRWKMKYLKGADTFGTIVGSAAVLKDENYLYAFSVLEPGTHEAYLLRWKIADVCNGNLAKPEWWFKGQWAERKTKEPAPEALFIGGTEYSVHWDAALKKYLQIQSHGFGAGSIGIRMADHLQGPWTDLHLFFTPDYRGFTKPFMYAAKAHPELNGGGLAITYNVNSFDFGELLENQDIYFPKFLEISIKRNQ